MKGGKLAILNSLKWCGARAAWRAIGTMVLTLALLASLGGAAAQAPRALEAPARPAADFKAGELLVGLAASLPAGAAQALPERYGARLDRTLLSGDVQVWQVEAGQELAIAQELLAEPDVAYAEPNYRYNATVTPNDPGLANQWGHTRMQSEAAWDLSTGSTSVIIAIIDTGIDETHPDLAGKIVAGYDFVGNDTNPHDENGHGTHCAGIAAAITNNAAGVAGMDWQARVMPVRVLDNTGSGWTDDIVDGITWATNHDAWVLSLSLGGSSYSAAMQNAVNAAHSAGRLVVAAMGNDNTSTPFYPAALDNVLAVAATGPGDGKASYSNYGNHCDVSAPGGDMTYYQDPAGIYSTMPTYPVYLTTAFYYYEDYDYLNGTSQATPYVAGLAGLIWSVRPGWGPDQVQTVIENTADDLGAAGWDRYFGHGRINALAALTLVQPGDHWTTLPLVAKRAVPQPRIVYTSEYTDAAPRFDVYVMNADGSGQTALTSGLTESYRAPAWSPDHTRIAVHATLANGEQRIYIMNADGSDKTLLFEAAGHHTHPTWSPDGSRIVFASDLASPGAQNDLYVIDADGSDGPYNLTNTPARSESQPAWSPDGTRIAYVVEPPDGAAGGGQASGPAPAAMAGGQVAAPAVGGGPEPVPRADVMASSPPRAPAAEPDDVLWSQPVSTLDWSAYISQEFPDDPTYSSFLADDFINTQDWLINGMYVPGDLWSGGTTLLAATELTWEIYADAGGVPAGDPWGGGASPIWSLTLVPSDPRVALTTGSSGYASDTTLTLATPISLPAGQWWLAFYPTMEIGVGGQYGRQPSDTTNDHVSQFINPGGAFGYGTGWQAWTVLGGTLADMAFRLHGVPGAGDNAEIYVMNADGSGQTNTSRSEYDDWGPSWSPDGDWLVFYRDLRTGSGQDNEIFKMQADGSGQVRLTDNAGQNLFPDWSPSGTRIVFHCYYDDYSDIYVMSTNGGTPLNLTNHQTSFGSTMPDW